MKWFYDLKTSAKITFSFLVLTTAMVVVGYIGISKMSAINDMADQIYQKELLGISYVKEANINLIYIDRAMKNLMLATTKEDRELYSKRIGEFDKMYRDNMEKARPLFYTDKTKQLLSNLDRAVADYQPIMTKIISLAKEDALQDKRESVTLSQSVGREKLNVIDDTLTELTRVKEENAKDFSLETTRTYDSNRLLLILVVVFSALFGIALGLIISKAISAPLLRGVEFASAVADGDLNQTIDLDRKDEVGQLADALNGMVSKLREIVAEVQAGADNVATGSTGNPPLFRRFEK